MVGKVTRKNEHLNIKNEYNLRLKKYVRSVLKIGELGQKEELKMREELKVKVQEMTNGKFVYISQAMRQNALSPNVSHNF